MNREEFNQVLQFIDLYSDDLKYDHDSYNSLIKGIKNNIIRDSENFILKEKESLKEQQEDMEILKTHPVDKFTEKQISSCKESIAFFERNIEYSSLKITEARKILQILEGLE